MIYIVIMIALLVMSYIYDYRRFPAGQLICFWGMLVIFILVAGLRYRLGNDTIMYMQDYKVLHPISQLGEMDFARSRYAPGYVILTSFFKSISPEFTVFQMFHSILVNSVIFFFIKRHTRHVFFALFLFFIYMYFVLLFQQMRESIAVSIFLLAWPAFRDRKWVWWYVASLVAMTFHVSATMMLFLPVICLPGVRQFFVFGRRTLIIGLGVLLAGLAISTVFFHYIQLMAVTEAMVERAQVYSKSELSGIMLNLNGVFSKFFQSLLYPFMAMLFIGAKKKQQGEDLSPNMKKFEAFAILSLYIGLFSIPIPIMSRYNNYFYLFAIIMISDWAFTVFPWFKRQVKLHYLYWLILFSPMIGFQMYNSYFKSLNKSGTISSYMLYYPYSSYFDQTIDADRERTFKYILR